MCKHENTVVWSKGSVRASYGEYDDDITEDLYCLDCHSVIELPEPERKLEDPGF